MPYNARIVDGVTYRPDAQVYPVSGGWGRALNGGRNGQMVLQAAALTIENDTIGWREWPLRKWVVVEWSSKRGSVGSIVYAGLITDASYSWKSRQLTLSHADIWWLWDKRLVVGNRTNALASTKLQWSNVTGQTIAKLAITTGRDGGSNPQYTLPMVIPANVAGSIDRVVYGYNLETVQDLLDEAMQSEGGPNLDFRPRWSSNWELEWVMEFNAWQDNFIDYDLDAGETPVVDLEYKIAGSGVTNVVYGKGEGSEKKMLVHVAKQVNSPYPALERVETFSKASKLAQLQRRTNGELQSANQPIRQINMTVMADGPPAAPGLELGSTIRWRADNDPGLPSGWSTDWTLIEITGSLTSDEIRLSFQEKGGDSVAFKNTNEGNLKDILRRLRALETASPTNNTAIGRDGLLVYDGGVITIENGGLDVTGSASISGVLNVSGSTTLSGTTSVTGPMTIAGTTTITGNTSIVGELVVTGPTTLDGITDIGGDTSVTGDFNVSGPTTLAGETTISGATSITGDTTVEGAFDVNGPATINGETSITGDTTVTGSFTMNGETELRGNTKITGTTELLNELKVASGKKVTLGNMSIENNGGSGQINFPDGALSSSSTFGLLLTNGTTIDLAAPQVRVEGSTTFEAGVQMDGLPPTSSPPNIHMGPSGALYRTSWTP